MQQRLKLVKAVARKRASTTRSGNMTYKIVRHSIGKGSFGKVSECVNERNETVAIKCVIIDDTYNGNEYEILKSLNHPNCIRVIDRYVETKDTDLVEHIVMEYISENLYTYMGTYSSINRRIPIFYVKLFGFQIFSGLAYIHSNHIVHRDIKPANLLINVATGVLKICDFGSAKVIKEGMESNTYAVSRYYRAPELLMGCRKYNGSIDVWAAGCVIAEMLRGDFLFPGRNSEEMTRLITRVLGNPSNDDLHSIPHVVAFPFSNGVARGIESVLPERTPHDLMDLLKKIFVYNPNKRLRAKDCIKHKFFDELFVKGMTMPNNDPLPPLFR
jgi:serine/threonine protein kinase